MISRTKNISLLIAAVGLCVICLETAGGYEYSGILLKDVEVISNSKEEVDYANGLFDPVLGKPLSYRKLEEIIKLIQKREGVENVSVLEKESSNGSVTISVVVRLKFKISSVIFEGNRNISSAELKRKLGIVVGGHLDEDEIVLGIYEIKRSYGDIGYAGAEVKHEPIYSDIKDSGPLLFKIVEGKLYRLKDLKVVGELTEEDKNRLINRLGFKNNDTLAVGELHDRMASLARFLIKDGYLASSIGEPSVSYDDQNASGSVAVPVELGPRIKVFFKGNRYFFERDSRLKKAIRLSEERQFSQTWLEAAKYELERFYKQLGYALVKIDYEDNFDEQKKERRIAYKIEKGNRITIRKVDFKGAREYSSDELGEVLYKTSYESVQKKLYVREDFISALKQVIAYYQSKGYLNAERVGEIEEVLDKRKKRVDLTVSISEGERFTADNVNVYGNIFLPRDEILGVLAVKKSEPYNPYSVMEGTEKVRNIYLENGYKFVKIYRSESVKEGKVDLKVYITEGDRVKIGRILVKGNRTTEENVIRREFDLSEEEYYSPEKLSRAETNVARLGLFSSVGIMESSYDSNTGTVNYILTVEEKKKRSLRTRLGYGTEKGLRGGVELSFINIAGKGRTLSLGATLSHRLRPENILRRKEGISFREPRLFGSRFAGKFGILDEREEEPQFNIDRTSVVLGVDISLSKRITNSITYNLESRKPFDVKVDPSELSPFDESRQRLAFIDFTLDYDRRNNIFNATKGFLNKAIYDFYSRSLGSEANFLQFYSSNSFYQPIYRGIRALLAVKFGFSTTYGQTRSDGIPIPIEKRFRLGGSDTLRGFAYNSVGGLGPDEPAVIESGSDERAPGGNSVFNYNLEFIFPFILNCDLVLFTDGGEAYKSNYDFNPLDIRNTMGFGLRYNTPVGPLRLDVGFILDRRTGEPWGAVQFAVGLL